MKKFIIFISFSFLLLISSKITAQTLELQDPFFDLVSHADYLYPETHTGLASWYSYCGGLFAASTKFKKGSILRVVNPANGKHVDVTVNDYGPSKKKHPKRIIDLDKVAFKKIAKLRKGVINIIFFCFRSLLKKSLGVITTSRLFLLTKITLRGNFIQTFVNIQN